MLSNSLKPSIIINLDLGESKKVLKIFEGDDLYVIAKEFCEREGLSDDCIEYLVETISEEYERKKSQRSSAKEEKIPDHKDNFRLSFGNNYDVFQVESSEEESKERFTFPISENLNNFEQVQIIPEPKVRYTEKPKLKESDGFQYNPNFAMNQLHHSSKLTVSDTNSRLYHSGVKKMNRVVENTNNHIKQKEFEQIKECTFSPNLSKGKSNNASPKLRVKAKDLNDKVTTNIKDYFRKKKKFEELREENEKKNCTFIPKINKNSKRIATEVSKDFPGTSFQEKLYNKCKSKSRERDESLKQEFNKIYTFHPTIHPKLATNRDTNSSTNLSKSRCSQHSHTPDHIKSLCQNEKLFQPKINKDSHYYKVKIAQDQELKEIEENLTNSRRKPIERTPKESKHKGISVSPLKRRDIQPTKSQRKPSVKPDIQEILPFLQKFFHLLDDDHDGIISPEKICLSNCSLEMLQAYQSVFERIDEINQEIDFNSFSQLIVSQPTLIKYTKILMNGENLKITSEDENMDSTEIQSSKHSYTFSFGDFAENRKILEGILKKQTDLLNIVEENDERSFNSSTKECFSPLTKKYSRLAQSSFKR